MKSLRTTKATYVAALLLGIVIALIAVMPIRAAEPFRLDRVAIVRFTESAPGHLRRHQGILELDGRVTWRSWADIPRPANTPVWALARNLITVHAWSSYHQLGQGVLVNFELAEGAVRFAIGEESFHFIAPSELAFFATGRVINLSTRARVGPGGDQVIAGFVIDERPRTVLIRAIGPGLARFNVAAPISDPFLSVKQGNLTLAFNDNWSTRPDAAAIRDAAARVGAFPLENASRDAARLLVLPPGNYTVHVEAASPEISGGQVLVEIYSVPDDIYVDLASQL